MSIFTPFFVLLMFAVCEVKKMLDNLQWDMKVVVLEGRTILFCCAVDLRSLQVVLQMNPSPVYLSDIKEGKKKRGRGHDATKCGMIYYNPTKRILTRRQTRPVDKMTQEWRQE